MKIRVFGTKIPKLVEDKGIWWSPPLHVGSQVPRSPQYLSHYPFARFDLMLSFEKG